MVNISDDERKKRFLREVPPDGTGIGNKDLRERLGYSVESYQRVRDQLIEEGIIESWRGRGGSVRRVEEKPRVRSARGRAPRRREDSGQRSERSLYPRFHQNLELWAKDQGWTDFVVRETANQGKRRTGGRYTRPDFVVLGVKKFEYTPGVVRDLVTFEVKPHGANIDAVFEAAAQSRNATKSYLALEKTDSSPTEDQLSRFQAECQRFEVGLILFKRGDDYTRWDHLVDPIRKEPDPDLLESFIKNQVSPKDQERIRKWFR